MWRIVWEVLMEVRRHPLQSLVIMLVGAIVGYVLISALMRVIL